MSTEVLKMALGALDGMMALEVEDHMRGSDDQDICGEVRDALSAMEALRQAIEKPTRSSLLTTENLADPEYMKAYVDSMQDYVDQQSAVIKAPPTRKWIGLTEDEAHLCFRTANVWTAIEAKLKEKNTAQS